MSRKIATLALFVFTASGCASVKEGIVGEEHEDVGPFAEATIELMTRAQLDFDEADLVYLRTYYDANEAAMQRLTEVLYRIDDYRADIIDYSVELVRISETYGTEAAKCNALAELVADGAQERLIRDHQISAEEYLAMADSLRGQTGFLACLRTLQPMIVRSGDAFADMIFKAETVLLPEMIDILDTGIKREYATVLAQLDVVYERRDELFRGLQAIHSYRKGNKDALQVLNTGTAVTNPAFRLPATPSDAQLERTKDHIIEQLQKEEAILAMLVGDEADYIATYAELEAEERAILKGLDIARRQVLAWVRAHQALADGVRDPGKWLKGILQVMDAYRSVN